MNKLKGLILLTAMMITSYVLAGTPVNVSARPAADGNALYAAKCAICHGKDGRGTPNWRAKGQPDFTNADWQKSRTDAQFTASIKNGKGKMPAFKLGDADIAALVAKVRAFGKK